jgi:hypothetical protein
VSTPWPTREERIVAIVAVRRVTSGYVRQPTEENIADAVLIALRPFVRGREADAAWDAAYEQNDEERFADGT